MKKCTKCSAINDDDAKFCKSCGCTQFLAHNTLKWHSKKPEAKEETTWNALDIVKKYGSSDLLRWMSLLFILLALYEIITSINSLLYIRAIYREFEKENIHQFDQFLTYFGILVVISMVLTFAVNFAIWSGMLKFRESSKMFSNERFEIKGLNIIRVSLIVRLVLSGLFILCCIILLNSLNSIPSVVDNVLPVYGFEEDGSIVLIISLLFEALYSILLINTVSSIINTVKTGIPSGSVSMFIIVVNFINAIIYLLSIFTLKNTQEGILSKIYAAGFVAFFIIFSILLLQYRAEIGAYKESFRFENPYLGENKT